MSNFGQGITAVVGGVIGFVVGGPAGAAYGFQLGLLAGSALFPTQLPSASGPRLEDLNTTTAEIGGPVIIPWGSPPVPGTVIHLGELVEVETTEKQGGKGAPEQSVTTYSYYQNIAIGLCEHAEGLGIAAVWENGAIVYDVRPIREDESADTYNERQSASAAYADAFVFYDGNEDQLPDPTIELDKGAGNVPAYRGLAYIVMPHRQLKDDQGRHHPSFRFLMTTANEAVVEVTEYSPSARYTFLGGGAQNPRNVHKYSTDHTDTSGNPINDVTDTEIQLQFIIEERDKAYGHILVSTLPANIYGDRVSHVYTEFAFGFSLEEFNEAMALPAYSSQFSLQSPISPGNPGFIGFGQFIVRLMNTFTSQGGGVFVMEVVPGENSPPSSAPTSDFFVNGFGDPSPESTAHFWRCVFIEVKAQYRAPDNPCLPLGLPPADFISPNFCELEDGTIAESKYWTDEGFFFWALQIGYVDALPLGPAFPQNIIEETPDALSEEFWTNAYTEAYAAGLIEGGKHFVNPLLNESGDDIYPQHLGSGAPDVPRLYSITRRRTVLDSTYVSLAQIVREVCARVGLTNIDVEDLRTINVGFFASTRVSTARSLIEPLRPIGLFDIVESDETLRFVVRGKPIVAALTEEDLGAHEAGTDRPPLITTKKAQDVELPRVVRVHYLAESRDYERGEQQSSVRVETDAVQDIDLDVVAGITDDQAKQIAEIVQADAWVSRWSHSFAGDQSQSALECADAVTVPIDGRIQRVRIVNITESIPILRRFETVRDDADAFVSTAVASVPNRSPQVITILKASDLVLLDLAPLRDEDDDAGIYAAAMATGAGNRWQGVAVRRSVDGTTFTQLLTITSEARVGELVTALPSGITTTWDDANELLVELPERFSLESRTEADVLAGANAAAIGAHGRWEIVQFRDAVEYTANNWRLTGLLRGRRGTEHNVGGSLIADTFVLLSGPGVGRLPLQHSQIGASFIYRAITVNASDATGVNQTFAGAGEALKPFSPVDLAGTRDGSDNLTLTWTRRGRFGDTLHGGADVPLSEETEAYEIDIMDLTSVVRTLTSSTPTVIYSAADQTADGLTPGDPVRVLVYQLSAIVGRGHPVEAIV
jgi:hypothetical protein